MKLCKDCKHVAMPHPLATLSQYNGQPQIFHPMCAHPDAKRSVVDGSLQVSCFDARGEGSIGASNRSVCWPDAKLFEQREHAPEPEPLQSYSIVEVEMQTKKSFWRCLFG